MQRRHRMDEQQVDRALQLLGRLPVTVDSEGVLLSTALAVHRLMQRYALTAYDPTYLELSIRRNVRLSTLDMARRSEEGVLCGRVGVLRRFKEVGEW